MSSIAFRSTHPAVMDGLADHQAQLAALVGRLKAWREDLVARFGDNPDGSPRTLTLLRHHGITPVLVGFSGSGSEPAILAAGFEPAGFPLRGYKAGNSTWQEMVALTKIEPWSVPGIPRSCKVTVGEETYRAWAVLFGADGAAYVSYPTDGHASAAEAIRAAVAAQSEADGVAGVWDEVTAEALEQVIASLDQGDEESAAETAEGAQ